MAFWQYPWHITVARLRRTSTGFPCSACSPQATKPICSFQAKEKATQADFCQCDRMFSQPAFLHPISGMRSGFSHGRYSGSAHLRGLRLLRLYPAFSGFPNDRISPRIQASALTATGKARISTGSLISTPELSQPTQDMGHHAAIQLLKTNFCAILHMETENRKAGKPESISLRKTLDESIPIHISSHPYKLIIS